jgi:hypothetical protein
MKWFQERKGFQGGKESKKGNERTQEEIVQRRKTEFKHRTRISKNPHYCKALDLAPPPTPPPPPASTNHTDRRKTKI